MSAVLTPLVEKQGQFSLFVARLILDLYKLGYTVGFGEAWRPPEMVEIYAKDGRGSKNSLHPERLAVDLVLRDKKGVLLTETEQYKEAGELWESYSDASYKACWGGRFGDGNHFSFAHGGRK